VVKLQDIGIKYVVSPTLGVIRGTKVRRDYLLYALKSKGIAEQFNKIMSGSTRSSVGMIVLRKLDVILPLDQAEQSRIASILSDMDAEIAELDAKLAKARQVKQGMMQELLTGRIRLI
jgi:type I restriction enzyme S subunit